jgi:hypothetical protein
MSTLAANALATAGTARRSAAGITVESALLRLVIRLAEVEPECCATSRS